MLSFNLLFVPFAVFWVCCLFSYSITATDCNLVVTDDHPCMGFTGDNCTYDESSLLKKIFKIRDVATCVHNCTVTYHKKCTYYIYDDFGHHDECYLLKGPFDPFKNFCTKVNGAVTPSLATCVKSEDPCKVRYIY